MPKAAPLAELDDLQIAAIQEWQKTKAELDDAKTREMLQRMVIVNTAPWASDKEEGGQTLKLGGNWSLKLDRPMDYKMEQNNIPACMSALHALNEVNPIALVGLVRWVPVLSASAYKALSTEEKKILAPVVTIKPGTPVVELKPPATPKA